MAGKHLSSVSRGRSPSLSFPPSARLAFCLFTIFLLGFGLVFFFFFSSSSSSHSAFTYRNPRSSRSNNPLFTKPSSENPEFSFVASLEKFLTSRAQIPKSELGSNGSVISHGEDVRKLDNLVWEKEMDKIYEEPLYPALLPSSSSVLRVYVYEMPPKFTYDLLWLFRNTYKETSNLTSNGSPVHRLIEQHSIDYWLWADLIAPESERLLKNVIRVHQQEEADLFYIPFFTTISFFLLEKQPCKALYRAIISAIMSQGSICSESPCQVVMHYDRNSQFSGKYSPFDNFFACTCHSIQVYTPRQQIRCSLPCFLGDTLNYGVDFKLWKSALIPMDLELPIELQPKCFSQSRITCEALQWVTDQPAWKRSEGRDHILPVHHPWSFKTVRRFMKKAIWLLPDMDSTGNWYKPGQVWLEKDVILPYVPNVEVCDAKCFAESESKRTTLLFFRGRLKRNAGGKIRAKLGAELNGVEGVSIAEGTAGEDGKKAAQDGMRKSIFCLSPAGDTPSSARMFDAIVSGCIPVVVSDELELPFEGILDYRKIALFVSSSDAVQPGWLITFLKSIGPDQIREMRANLAKYLRHFLYSRPAQPFGPEDLTWRMIASKLLNIKLHIRRSQRVVKESRSLCTCDCRRANRTSSAS